MWYSIWMEIEQKQSNSQSFWELVKFAALAIIIVVPIRVFIAQPFVVSGSSMVPTFENGEYLIINELSYRLGDPQRGDVVVFRYPNDTKKFFIKRVIGLPHEKVVIEGSTIKIINAAHPDGFILEEPYVKNISNNSLTSELKDDEYFVMGDNRSASSDSRYWGPVHRNLFIGKTFLRLLPINTLSYAPGDYKQVN